MAYRSTQLEGAIIRAEAILAALRPKKRKKDAPELIPYIKRTYVLDAVQRIYLAYRDNLPPTKTGKPSQWFSSVLTRLLPATQYATAEYIDILLDELVDKLTTSDQRPVQRLVDRVKKVKVRNVNEVKKNWIKQVSAIDKVFVQRGAQKRLKELLGDRHFRILALYIKSEKTVMDCALLLAKSKVLIDPRDIPPLRLAKFSLKSLKKYDDKFLARLKKSGGLSEDDVGFVVDETEPQKGPKRVAKKGAITPETAPQFFTREKPYELLWKPIPEDAIDLFIQKPKKSPKTGKWSYYATFTDPRSGVKVTTYLQKHREENETSKFDTVRNFDKKGYDNIISANKGFLSSKDPDEQTLALIVYLVHVGYFRIGNPKSEKDNVFGIHNLQVKHVKQNGKNLTFDYSAKKQKRDVVTIKCSRQVLRIFQRLVRGKDRNDYIFTTKDGEKISEGAVNSFLKKKLKVPKGVTIHKFRHIATTRLFRDIIVNGLPRGWKSMPLEEKVKWYQGNLEVIRGKIRHDTIKTTLDSYIDPKVVNEFDKANGFEDLSITAKNPLRGLKKKTPKKKTTRKKKKTIPPKTRKKTTVIRKVVKKKKKLKEIKEKVRKKPKRLIVRIRKEEKPDKDIEFTGEEIDDLEDEIDDMLEEYEPIAASIDQSLVSLASLRIASSETAIALAKVRYKKGDRCIAKIAKQFFIGTVTAFRQGNVYIKLDSGESVKFRAGSKFLIAKGVKRKRKSAIPAKDLQKWMVKDDSQLAEKESGPKTPVKRDLQVTLKKVAEKLRKEKSPLRRTVLKKRQKELKLKISKREQREAARIKKNEEKQKKIAEREAKKLLRDKRKQERLDKQKAVKEAKRLRALRKVKRTEDKKRKEQERIRKAAERKAAKELKEQAKKDRERKKKVSKKDRLEKSRKTAEKVQRQLEKGKIEKTRKKIAEPPQKTPKVQTPTKTLKKVTRKKPKTPTKKKITAPRGMAAILRSVRNTLGSQLTGIPKLFLEPTNLMFLSPGNTKKRNTVGIKFEVIDEEQSDIICKLTAYLDKDNFIEGYFNSIKDQWQIFDDQSFGIARVRVKRDGYVTDSRFLDAVTGLIEEAKVRSGYIDDEAVFLQDLSKTLKKFAPSVTKDKKSVLVNVPLQRRTQESLQPSVEVGEKISLPNIEEMDARELKVFMRKHGLKVTLAPEKLKQAQEKRIHDKIKPGEYKKLFPKSKGKPVYPKTGEPSVEELRKAVRKSIKNHNNQVMVRKEVKKLGDERQESFKGSNLLLTLKEDGWKEVGMNVNVIGPRSEKRTVYLQKGNSQIVLIEESGQTVITPLSMAEAMVLQELFNKPTQAQVRTVLAFR